MEVLTYNMYRVQVEVGCSVLIASNSCLYTGHNYLTEEEMAAEINNYPAGTVRNLYLYHLFRLSPVTKPLHLHLHPLQVSHLYLTSDGGMNLETVYRMVALLDPHVKVVNHEELVEMARQREASRNA